jgi:catechol 2,3-dioxygenase
MSNNTPQYEAILSPSLGAGQGKDWRLPDATHIGYAHLSVAHLDRALDFYGRQLGLHQIARDGDTVTLSANDQPHIILTEKPGGKARPGRAIGLYHVAIRLPNRVALARLFARLIEQRYPFGGFSDHAVSEALYLSDPDGNGLELYTDRPRDQWPRQGDQIAMTTQTLDVDDLLDQLSKDSSAWQGIDPGTDIGHVHLHVSSLERAHAFYVDTLGMDLVADWRSHGALFVSAGGYHHHLGLNIWAGSARPPAEAVGLLAYSLVLPDASAVEALRARLMGQGHTVEPAADGFTVLDMDGNQVQVTTE